MTDPPPQQQSLKHLLPVRHLIDQKLGISNGPVIAKRPRLPPRRLEPQSLLRDSSKKRKAKPSEKVEKPPKRSSSTSKSQTTIVLPSWGDFMAQKKLPRQNSVGNVSSFDPPSPVKSPEKKQSENVDNDGGDLRNNLFQYPVGSRAVGGMAPRRHVKHQGSRLLPTLSPPPYWLKNQQQAQEEAFNEEEIKDDEPHRTGRRAVVEQLSAQKTRKSIVNKFIEEVLPVSKKEHMPQGEQKHAVKPFDEAEQLAQCAIETVSQVYQDVLMDDDLSFIRNDIQSFSTRQLQEKFQELDNEIARLKLRKETVLQQSIKLGLYSNDNNTNFGVQ